MASLIFNVGTNLQTRNEQKFLFKDIIVPVKRDKSNYDLQSAVDVEAIRNSIRNIFDWNTGERIINPSFGNPVLEYLYEPINNETAKRIGQSINSAITKWEPRVNITNINIIPYEDLNQYYISINFDIKGAKILAQEYELILAL